MVVVFVGWRFLRWYGLAPECQQIVSLLEGGWPMCIKGLDISRSQVTNRCKRERVTLFVAYAIHHGNEVVLSLSSPTLGAFSVCAIVIN